MTMNTAKRMLGRRNLSEKGTEEDGGNSAGGGLDGCDQSHEQEHEDDAEAARVESRSAHGF